MIFKAPSNTVSHLVVTGEEEMQETHGHSYKDNNSTRSFLKQPKGKPYHVDMISVSFTVTQMVLNGVSDIGQLFISSPLMLIMKTLG